MKSHILIITLFLTWACMPTTDDSHDLLLDTYECIVGAKGGEKVINILTYYPYDCVYSEDWLLVRYQKDKIKIIVDANPSEVERFAQVGIVCNGEEIAQLIIKQEGLSLNIEQNTILADCLGNELVIEVKSNTNWTIKNVSDWITTDKKDSSHIALSVERNYNLSDRSDTITIQAGDAQSTIIVNQEASPWYHSIEMISVKGGNFTMGAQNQHEDKPNYDEYAYSIESPTRNISIKDYYISKFEISQVQWREAMGYNPSSIQGDFLPVEMVSWEDTQEFISILNDITGLNYRLPTEAEWEYAARGGAKSLNYLYSGASVLSLCGWYYANSNTSTHNIGEKSPNELGVYDMSGNVREWCQDWHDYYDDTDLDNPIGPTMGIKKVNRGGAWNTPAINCRNSYRGANLPDEVFSDLGFRLVLDK